MIQNACKTLRGKANLRGWQKEKFKNFLKILKSWIKIGSSIQFIFFCLNPLPLSIKSYNNNSRLATEYTGCKCAAWQPQSYIDNFVINSLNCYGLLQNLSECSASTILCGMENCLNIDIWIASQVDILITLTRLSHFHDWMSFSVCAFVTIFWMVGMKNNNRILIALNETFSSRLIRCNKILLSTIIMTQASKCAFIKSLEWISYRRLQFNEFMEYM